MSRSNLFRPSLLTRCLASHLASLLAAVVAFSLAAGSRAEQPHATGQLVEAAVDNTATDANDAAITAAIKAEMARDTELSASRINVDTKEGRVVLRGTAPNALARDRAARLAATVEGVRSVDNQVLLNSSSSSG